MLQLLWNPLLKVASFPSLRSFRFNSENVSKSACPVPLVPLLPYSTAQTLKLPTTALALHVARQPIERLLEPFPRHEGWHVADIYMYTVDFRPHETRLSFFHDLLERVFTTNPVCGSSWIILPPICLINSSVWFRDDGYVYLLLSHRLL